MSGHSKWKTIKRQKGVADIKRGQTFTKISNAITIAVRAGGGSNDPSANFRLRLAIEKARSVNMPRENIERAIDRALGKQASNIEEAVYEGFGHGKTSVIVIAATDNKQRTTNEIKNIFEKVGGTFAKPGSVSYQFSTKGRIVVAKNSKTMDEVFLSAADAGAEDVEEAEEEIVVYTRPEDLRSVRDALVEKGITLRDIEIIRKPLLVITPEDAATRDKISALIERLEELDDVQKVYTNIS